MKTQQFKHTGQFDSAGAYLPRKLVECKQSCLVAALGITLALFGTGRAAQAQQVFSSNLSLANGIEADSSGNIYVNYDAVFSTALSKFSSNATPLGTNTYGGITSGNIGRIARVPGSNDMLLLTQQGSILLFGPNLELTSYIDLSSINNQIAEGVYDVTTNRFRSLVLGLPTWGDIAAFWARNDLLYLYISGTTNAAGGFPFTLRLDIDLSLNQLSWRVVATSTGTTAGSANQPRGIAVNSAGWVLTGYPFVVPNSGFADSLVAFRTSFPEVANSTTVPRFVLRTNQTQTGLWDMASIGMTTDAAGNFYVATGAVGASPCGSGGSSVLVLINSNPTSPNPRCSPLPSILAFSNDVAVSPIGNIPYMTVNNQVIRFPRLINTASTTGSAVPKAEVSIDSRRLLKLKNAPLIQKK